MNEIIRPFKDSLFDSDIKDIVLDFAELGIDSVLQDGLLKDIPLVGSIMKLKGFAYNVYDRNLLKQAVTFINEFNSNCIDPNKLKKYREELNNDFSKAEEELGRVLIYLNKIIDKEKSTILARLYLAYINEEISWTKFCELSDVTDRLFIDDILILKDVCKYKNLNFQEDYIYIYKRLIALGLIKDDINYLNTYVSFSSNGEDIFKQKHSKVQLTNLGDIFCSKL